MVHENGGQVYLDGANMNAQVRISKYILQAGFATDRSTGLNKVENYCKIDQSKFKFLDHQNVHIMISQEFKRNSN